MKRKYFHLISIQFLGFRYSGWQKQTNAKTVQEMVDKTFEYLFGHDNFRTLGAGRTDAKVSANEFFFELFTDEVLDQEKLLEDLNSNFPPDIKALSIKSVDKNFNVIQDSKVKEYTYLFSYGEKIHPFGAAFLVGFLGDLDIEQMKKGAKLFEGKHNFQRYCHKPSVDTIFEREVLLCELEKNEKYHANFFPETTWLLKVQGKGFMRQQIRLMVGTLVELGRGTFTLKEIEESLKGGDNNQLGFIAPASGLMLNSVEFD